MDKLDVRYNQNHNSIRAYATAELADGTRKQFYGYGRTETLARRSLMAKVKAADEDARYGVDRKAGNLPLKDSVREYIESKITAFNIDKGRSVRDTTIRRDYQTLDSLILPCPISEKPIKHIVITDLEGWQAWLDRAEYDSCRAADPHEPRMKPYSASQKNRAVSLVKNTLDGFYKHRPEKNPACVLERYREKHVPKKDSDVLCASEIKSFLALCADKSQNPVNPLDATYADLFTLMLLTGLRLGEALGLEARDFDSVKGCINIKRTAGYGDGRTKTAVSADSVFLASDALGILMRRTASLGDTDLIFPSGNGTWLSKSNCNRRFHQWLESLGIDKNLSPKSLRATCASQMFDAGLSADDVATVLRHADTKTSNQFYIARSDGRKTAIRDHMAMIFDGN